MKTDFSIVADRTSPAELTLGDIEARLDRLPAVFTQHGVRLAYLFGSLLERSHGRDVDIAVLFQTYRFDRYLQTYQAVSQVLQTDRLDLVVLNRANPRLALQALLDGRLLYATTPILSTEVTADVLFAYDDYRYFGDLHRFYMDRHCQEGLSMADRRVDRERIEIILSSLDEAIAQIIRLRKRFDSYDDFYFDVDTRELCIHYLRISLEAVLDICRHYVAAAGVSLTEVDTTSLIDLAGEKGLFDPQVARRIRGMAGMRNAIVHVYWRVDYEAVYRAVTAELSDFDEFVRQVRSYLFQESNQGS